jgi:magnesium transporter
LWLGVNLATAFLAASVVDLFQSTLDKIVLLAVLMPVVPSMGGVAGSQSLVVITRALALGQVDRNNAERILRKELLVGLLNGFAWSAVVAFFTYVWFSEWRIGAVIAGAMVINMAVAALAGFSVPLVLRRLHIDPALAGGVVLTTITDVIGYLSFLGLGAAFLI